MVEEALKALAALWGILPESFWSERVYSRLVSWGREFRELKAYLLQNVLEAAGEGCDETSGAQSHVSATGTIFLFSAQVHLGR